MPPLLWLSSLLVTLSLDWSSPCPHCIQKYHQLLSDVSCELSWYETTQTDTSAGACWSRPPLSCGGSSVSHLSRWPRSPSPPTLRVKCVYYFSFPQTFLCNEEKCRQGKLYFSIFSLSSIVDLMIYLVRSAATRRKVRGESCVCSLIRLDHLFLLQFHYYVHAWLSF